MNSYKSSYRTFSSVPDESSSFTFTSSFFKSEIHQISSSFCDKTSTKFIIYNPEERTFQVFQDADLFFSAITGRIFVISVSGIPIIGKSTLLNLLVNMINHLIECQGRKQMAINKFDSQMTLRDVFEVGNGRSTQTEELEYVCLTWGSDNILFLDLEGNDDPKRAKQGTWIYANLISTSVALSHIHLHNFRGVLGATFLSYFNDIMKIITQSKLHKEEFKPLVHFVKKDETDLEGSKEAVESSIKDQHLLNSGADFEVEVFQNKPEHLFRECMNGKRPICDECKKSSYIIEIKKLAIKIFDELKDMAPYPSGKEFLQRVYQVLSMNQRDLAYVRDNGVLPGYRDNRLKNEQIRIKENLINLRSPSVDRKFCQDIIELFKNRPELIKANVLQKLKQTVDLVYYKLPHLSLLLTELTNFIRKILEDKTFSVLSDQEIELAIETYVERFLVTMSEVLRGFHEFHEVLDGIVAQLGPLQEDFRQHLRDFLRAKSYHRAQNAVIGIPMTVRSSISLQEM